MPSKNRNHEFDFIELPAKDIFQLKNAQSFFSAVFGWTYKNWGDDYTDTSSSGINSGINADPKHRPNHPLPVVFTTDLELMRDKVLAAGGKITKNIFSFPGGRRFHFKDPAENELAVWSDPKKLDKE
ncbi:MAG: VOC family protein [Candidatus Competibacteraceae bacterium]|nr:VOC family protein [Candidatus Competibacteraceae bacterium]